MVGHEGQRGMASSRGRRRRNVGTFALSLGLLVVAASLAPAANADSASDAFLGALNAAGVNYADPDSAVALGQSICPVLSQPGGSIATAASNVMGQNGISADMAGLFTSIAISTYCPSVVASIANGDFADGNFASIPQIPGLSLLGLPGQ